MTFNFKYKLSIFTLLSLIFLNPAFATELQALQPRIQSAWNDPAAESSSEDISKESTINNRKKWLDSGASWFNKEKMPWDWNLDNQLKNISNS